MRKGEMLSKMIIRATNGHAGQFDKAGLPYILHPLKVMHYLKSNDEELMCAAVGHDLFEDTDVTAEDLRADGISERVIDTIFGVTKMPGESPAEYRAKVKQNLDRIAVKKADLRHNSDIRRMKEKTVTEKDVQRTIKYMEFYAELEAAEELLKCSCKEA